MAACGANPASPSEGGSGATAGAVLAGTVTTSQAGLSLAGLTAQVVGTNLSSAVADSGAFEIQGVRAGSVRLQFRNSAVNATADIAAVRTDQFIQLRVEVTGTSAVIVQEERTDKVSLCHTEGNGTYHLIDVSVDAESSHRAHGDGKIGDPVPGRPSLTFDENCRPAGPAIDIEKSTNGEDADNAPGPSIVVGSAVTWRYVVTNTGTLPLTAVSVTDDKGVVVNCNGQTTLAPSASMTCTGTGVAVLGQYSNIGSVTASWVNGALSGTTTDSDASHYLGIAPIIDEEEGPKVTLCHRTGNGSYHSINVSISAEPAHRAHGDAKPGEAVPDLPGRVFTSSCGVQ